MPYEGQDGSKTAHGDLVRSPIVQDFLGECEYMREPSAEQGQRVAEDYQPAPHTDDLPTYVLASDGSRSDVAINDQLPSTRLGFVKISQVMISMDLERQISGSGRYVDPFLVAELEQQADHFPMVLPGSNVRYGDQSTVARGYRLAVHRQLSRRDPKFPDVMSLSETLLALQGGTLRVQQCPECNEDTTALIFNASTMEQVCPHCQAPIFATDYLRLDEGITEQGDTSSTVTRAMNALEHLIFAQVMLLFKERNLYALPRTAFVMDGPLSLNGQPARLHRHLMRLINDVRIDLRGKGLAEPLILGLQKTGPLAEHARLMCPYMPTGSLRLVDDTYRSLYVREVTAENFGHHTHYGQEFIYKPSEDRVFVFSLPYPFREKSSQATFTQEKIEVDRYATLARACAFIRHFQTDLYQDALIPVALAHRHASISFQPGGKVLELLTRQALQRF